MKMRAFLIACVALLVAGCDKQMGTTPDAKAWLSSQEGPKVEGVQAALLKSAHDADLAGDWRTATSYYQQLADKNPDNKDIQISLADDLRKLGDTAKATSIYDMVLKKDPNNPAATEGKGLALMQQGDMDGAVQILLKLAQTDKASWRTYNAVGIIAASKQSPAAAKPYFEQALAMSPNNPSILNNIGLSQAMSHEFDSANATLTQAATLATPRPAFREQIELNNAMVYAAAGKLENAEAIARQYYTGAELSNNMGFYAHLANDDQLAKTYLNMALTQSKRFYPRAWDNLQDLNASAAPSSVPTASTEQASAAAPGAAPTTPVTMSAPEPTVAIAQPQLQPLPQAQPQLERQAQPAVQPEQDANGNRIIRPTMGYLPTPQSAHAAPEQEAALAQPSAPLPTQKNGQSAMVYYNPTGNPDAKADALGQMAPAAGESASASAPTPTMPQQQASAIQLPPPQGQAKEKPSNGFQAVGNWFGSMLDY